MLVEKKTAELVISDLICIMISIYIYMMWYTYKLHVTCIHYSVLLHSRCVYFLYYTFFAKNVVEFKV